MSEQRRRYLVMLETLFTYVLFYSPSRAIWIGQTDIRTEGVFRRLLPPSVELTFDPARDAATQPPPDPSKNCAVMYDSGYWYNEHCVDGSTDFGILCRVQTINRFGYDVHTGRVYMCSSFRSLIEIRREFLISHLKLNHTIGSLSQHHGQKLQQDK